MRETMTADALMSRHAAAWQAATVHPFLAGVRDGSLPEHPFDQWLARAGPGARPVPHREGLTVLDGLVSAGGTMRLGAQCRPNYGTGSVRYAPPES